LTTGDRDVERQIRLEGLTVWFDPAGGKEKAFGLRFPLGFLHGQGPDAGGVPAPPPPSGGEDSADTPPSEGEEGRRPGGMERGTRMLQILEAGRRARRLMAVPGGRGERGPPAAG